MMLLAYSRYPKMALLIIDPQGEFSKDMRRGGSSGEFALPVGDVARNLGKEIVVLTVRNLVLDRWDLFEQILCESQFFERLTIPQGENRQLACDILADKLQKANVGLKQLHERASFDKAWALLGDEKVQKVFYRTEASRARFDTALQEANADEFFGQHWSPVAELFREDRPNAKSINKALAWLLNPDVPNRPILVINLSKEQAKELFWNDRIQALVIKRLLDGVTQAASTFIRRGRA